MASIFDCVFFAVLFYAAGVLVGIDEAKRQAFRRYEQQRRAYTTERLRRIERGEM